jgi:all-trans-8'-apo-beta-carotenal 15,15'-oxygenase
MLNVYEFDTAGTQLARRRYPLEMQHSNHDFGFTAQHVIFYLSPLIMNFSRFWADGASVMESLSWEPERGSRMLIAPRGSCTDEPFTLRLGEGYCLHFINSYEANRKLIVDILELDEPVYAQYQPIPDLFVSVPRSRPVRYVIDLEKREITERRAMTYDLASDFAAINPCRLAGPNSDFWMLGMSKRGMPGRKFFDHLAHGSCDRGAVDDVYELPSGEYFGGEPAFVTNPDQPEEAAVIVEHLNARTDEAEFLLFDANAVRNGPIARLPLKHRIHPGFHSSFHAAD